MRTFTQGLGLFLAMGLSLSLHAQEAPSPRHELGVFSGSYLISYASEIIPATGARFSFAMSKSHIELQGFGGNISGVSYYLGDISWRKEFSFKQANGIFLFGFDWHYFRRRNSDVYELAQGWHVGTGLNVKVTKNLFFRNDYIFRLGLIRSLNITVGFTWAFGGSDS